MSEYVGTIGRKLTVPCKRFEFVKSIFNFRCVLYIYKFEDFAGNRYMWRAKNRLTDEQVAEVTEIKGTVQGHETTYDGVKETIMVCCVINPKRKHGIPKVSKPASKIAHSTGEVSKLLGVSHATVTLWCRDGIIRADDVRGTGSTKAMYSISNAEMARITRLRDKMSTTENVQWKKVLVNDLKPSVAYIKGDKKPVPAASTEKVLTPNPSPATSTEKMLTPNPSTKKATKKDDVSEIIEKVARYKRLCNEINHAEEKLVNMRAERDAMKSQIIGLL